jgi:hypothetical protein
MQAKYEFAVKFRKFIRKNSKSHYAIYNLSRFTEKFCELLIVAYFVIVYYNYIRNDEIVWLFCTKEH